MVTFNPKTDIPDLTGRVIIVTGGTDGLGKESVLQLSQHNPSHIYIAARSKSKAETCIQDLKTRNPTACPITFLELDLSSFKSIKAAARTFTASEPRLDILLCNAGIMGATGTTNEGYEIAFGVNHVGHALLIKLLFPLMQRTAKEHPDSDVRLVVLGSEAERLTPKNYYLFDEIKSDLGSYMAMTRYAHSKIANGHHVLALAKRYPEAENGVKIVCVHPGSVVTNLGHDILSGWPTVQKIFRRTANVLLGLVPVEQGVQNQLWACVAPGVEHGVYYHPVGLAGKGSSRTTDEEKAEELWAWTEKELEGHA